ncbi:ABC-type transport auxiliary lipoprotein family protein [Aquabacterium sp.]|uniref:ABC-type transport auxiliary lipoprotein family protein n=1 Tax=Aquabacterium sp. TaxID=1872578 RepID=UPI0037830E4F
MTYLIARRRTLLAAAATPLLNACVSVELGQDQPAQTWRDLHDPGHAQRLGAPLVPALLVQALPADAIADTASIAYSRRPHEYAFYQLASWTERPVRLVPRLLQRRLQQRGVAGAVGQLGDPMRADWLLSIALETLYHDVSVEPGQGRLTMVAELFDRRQRLRVARHRIQAQAPAASADSAGGAEAMSQALAQAFDALLPWLEQALQQALAAATPARGSAPP